MRNRKLHLFERGQDQIRRKQITDFINNPKYSLQINKIRVKLNINTSFDICRIIQNVQLYRFVTIASFASTTLSVRACQLLSQTNWLFLLDLNLNKTKINDAGLVHLKRVKWKYLRELELSCNQIRNRGIWIISKCELTNLIYLGLKSTCVTGQSFKCLTRANFPSIKIINFCQTDLGHIDILSFAKTCWTKLTTLDFHTKNSSKCYSSCAVLAKFPIEFYRINFCLMSPQTALNSLKAIENLSTIFENARCFCYLWEIRDDYNRNVSSDDE